MAEARLSWNQPICRGDWDLLEPGGREPVKIVDPYPETCAWCGERTWSGIYVRRDPATVPYPARNTDD